MEEDYLEYGRGIAWNVGGDGGMKNAPCLEWNTGLGCALQALATCVKNRGYEVCPACVGRLHEVDVG